MIIGILHKGSGLGDQLFSYIATRVRAADLGVDFGFVGKAFFKGVDFMKLDWGKDVDLKYHVEYPAGKVVIDDEHKLYVLDKPYYDPEFNFIEDGTVIDGYGAQDERYWNGWSIRSWLEVKPLEMSDNVCVINFRGGEFVTVPQLFLSKSYWDAAIAKMREEYLDIEFEVHTDDPVLAKQFFSDFECIKDIGLNWRSVRYAKHLILSNSAFGIIPALIGEAKEVIAPRYWARRNTQEWSLPSNYYSKFTYI